MAKVEVVRFCSKGRGGVWCLLWQAWFRAGVRTLSVGLGPGRQGSTQDPAPVAGSPQPDNRISPSGELRCPGQADARASTPQAGRALPQSLPGDSRAEHRQNGARHRSSCGQ